MAVAAAAALVGVLGLAVLVLVVVNGLGLLDTTIAISAAVCEKRLLGRLLVVVFGRRLFRVLTRIDVLQSTGIDDGTTK